MKINNRIGLGMWGNDFIFATATSEKNYEKDKLFGGDSSSSTNADVAVTHQVPASFFTPKFCDK